MKIKVNENTEVELLKKHSFECSCGKKHEMGIDEVIIGSNLLEKIPEIVEKYHMGKQVFVVMDQMIYGLYGEKIENTLKKADYKAKMNVFKDKTVLPNEMALAEMLINIEEGTQWILAIGSGAVTDLSRYLSYKMNIPYVSVPTAASMDGYTADSALLLLNGLKQTCKATYPKIIIGDTTILKGTPQILLAAGFGDLTAKITAGADWELGHIVTGVDYCPFVEKIVMDAVDRAIKVSDGISKNDEESAGVLFEGLMITGMPMHWTGLSQPLAGAEHHLTHFWGMKAVAQGRRPHMHGIEVAQGIVLIMQVYKEFLAKDFSNIDVDKVVSAQIDKKAWEEDIKAHFGSSASSVFEENEFMAFDEESVRKEVEFLLAHMDEIKERVKAHLEPYKDIADVLKKVGCITSPAELDLSPEDVKESICYAHFVRKKYTVLRMLGRLGCLEEIADKVVSVIK
ncbi:MAG: sn-glycerol-1-phosphate dehydrogenase [Tyzzerella sp.]|uniref:Sn-glycerol-1-phosphate dehydrogenase n=1 Tax=Candidatus Fimicola merdigallinarum TaxID=2840819 RepID=A0A9D9H1I1_9FIRM|nr:sn-glycerol-1-phosphate dehydrogenase [Candidatus Fimicola merdigallinarum]